VAVIGSSSAEAVLLMELDAAPLPAGSHRLNRRVPLPDGSAARRAQNGADGSAGGAAVLVRIWQYDVALGHEREFERFYGPTGRWAQLFARSADYLGTELYRAVGQPGWYLTVDRFACAVAWRQLLDEHGEDYDALDSRCAELTTSEVELLG